MVETHTQIVGSTDEAAPVMHLIGSGGVVIDPMEVLNAPLRPPLVKETSDGD